ncbi:MAG: hypothetical protein ABW174_14605 [Flavitalea sp.]
MTLISVGTRGQRIGDKLIGGSAVVINGFVGERLRLSAVNRVFAQDVNRLVEPFRHRDEERCWQTEFWGKWFTSAVLAYKYKNADSLKVMLDKAVTDLVATQSADGYIGNYKPSKLLEQWDIWGRKYCMLGLLHGMMLRRIEKFFWQVHGLLITCLLILLRSIM